MKGVEMLFSPISIGPMRVENRIVMPAMTTSLADREGCITDDLISYYRERARGGAGYITVEHSCVHPSGKANDRMVCIYDDRYIDGFIKLAEAIHREGGKIVVQLNHAGRQALSSITGQEIVAPSSIPCPIMREVPRALSTEEICGIVDAFSDAARRVKRAGCDGVEFHMAHGYLVCEFLSPYSNHREDEYGGTIQNRTRFAREIIQRTRKQVGNDFPLICRMSADEMVEGGLSLDQSQVIAQDLVAVGADAIHVSACNYESYAFNMPCYYLEEGCFTHLAAGIKSSINVPTIAVGRIRSPLMAEEVLRNGKADLVAMGRALIADPYLPEKAFRGTLREIRPCLSCNTCVESISQNRLECAVNPDIRKEIRRGQSRKALSKRVLIVGGGPGGMEAARVASEMGDRVTLYESKSKVGGQLAHASSPPMKNVFRELMEYYEYLLSVREVDIRVNTRCTAEIVEQESPDFVIIATGSQCRFFSSEQVCSQVMSYNDALSNPENVGDTVIIVGGGPKGAEMADFFSTMGKNVTLVEAKKKIGFGLPSAIRFHLEKRLQKSHVEFLTRTEVLSVDDGRVRVKTKGVDKEIKGFNSVIMAMGRTPDNRLAQELGELSIPVFVVGDAEAPGGIKEAIANGARVAKELDHRS
jgi:2,4-dienoyl-CoA reductase-like NADH-dependent reductase (Old Yellow Enzyme family)/thioredoxin reductase